MVEAEAFQQRYGVLPPDTREAGLKLSTIDCQSVTLWDVDDQSPRTDCHCSPNMSHAARLLTAQPGYCHALDGRPDSEHKIAQAKYYNLPF